MKDYRIEVKVKNNILYRLMKRKGIDNPSELARLSGVSYRAVSNYMNLKDIPYSTKKIKEEQFKPSVLKLAEFFNVTPYEMFPIQHLDKPLLTNKAESELTFEEINQYILPGGNGSLLEHGLFEPEQIIFEDQKRDAVSDMLKTLTKREEIVMRAFYGIDQPKQTATEIAKNIDKMTGQKRLTGEKGVSKSRMRQIIMRAERKLRHPTRERIVRDFL
jgi:DNA-directed RNA polymerase specialized sigma subunit